MTPTPIFATPSITPTVRWPVRKWCTVCGRFLREKRLTRQRELRLLTDGETLPLVYRRTAACSPDYRHPDLTPL